MGMSAWLDLKGRDIVAFLVAAGTGFLLSLALPPAPWEAYIPVLVTYHLFLAWLILTEDRETGLAMPIVSTTLTHLACMAVVVSFVSGRHFIPYFDLIQYGIAGLAIFECGWLFVKSDKKKTEQTAAAPTSSPADYHEWLNELARKRTSPAAQGASLKVEYEKWLRTREQRRSA
jgi:hypothetical protein